MVEQLSRHPREAGAGLLSFALGVTLVIYSRTFPQMPGGYPGPGLFPSIIGWLLALFGLVLIIQAATGRVADTGEVREQGETRGRAIINVLVVVAAVPVYILMADLLGFRIAMAAVTLGLMLHLRTRIVVAVPVAIVLALTIAYLFGSVLRVPLPRGPFG